MQRSFQQRTPARLSPSPSPCRSSAAHTLDDGIPQTNGLRIDMAGAAYLHGDPPCRRRLAGTLGLATR